MVCATLLVALLDAPGKGKGANHEAEFELLPGVI
jgi:hypothetical protein